MNLLWESSNRADGGSQGIYTVLVNSTDSFEDCWDPFFELFAKYWRPHPPSILLNTERSSFQHRGLNVQTTEVARSPHDDPAWGESLRRAVQHISTPAVLYLQEDYFLHSNVKVDIVALYARRLLENGVDCIRLVETQNSGPWRPTADPLLWKVSWKSRYVVSLQASIWRTESLLRLISSGESPWEFERWGTRRARRAGYEVLCVNRNRFSGIGREIIPYVRTGVVRGKWNPVVVPLFERHGIHIDYEGRGFAAPRPKEDTSLRGRVHRARLAAEPYVDRALAALPVPPDR